jgi:hypothetical protein
MIKARRSRREIQMLSDNKQVVNAILNGSVTRDDEVNRVLDRIDGLYEMHNVALKIEWIPGNDNLADLPSRFMEENPEKRFPLDIRIPRCLEEFVTRVDF